MASPYIGEIRMFAGNFAPAGWEFCNGQLLQIGDFPNLFTVIGNTYGGDGINTFALPDLRGRLALHRGNLHPLGESGGTESVALTLSQIPSHTHVPVAQGIQGSQVVPTNGVWASSLLNQFSDSPPNAMMRADALAEAGMNQSHDNMMPFLTISFIISLFGVFPSS